MKIYQSLNLPKNFQIFQREKTTLLEQSSKTTPGEFDLTLISSFPDFRFKIQNVSVINVEPFAGDTLAYIKQISFDYSNISYL